MRPSPRPRQAIFRSRETLPFLRSVLDQDRVVEDVIDASEDDSGFPRTPPGHDRPPAAAAATPASDKAQRSPGLALVVNGARKRARRQHSTPT